VLALLWVSLSSVAASANPGFGGEGAKACIDCHGNGHVMGILKTAHAKVDDPDTPAAQQECQSCHGPSKIHMRFPMQVENLHFGKESKAKPEVQNQACLECHAKGARESWEVSAHGFEEVVCSKCHSIHDPAKIIPKTATLSGGCSVDGCHATLMGDADTARFSHAVGKKLGDDGQLTCASCHNPHGPLDSGRCIDCHAQTPEILAKESEKARRFHEVATRRTIGCIRCHQELSHPIKQLEELRRQGSVEGDSVQ
jgi:DmsE family decaheme c-type cytochrome